jgi:AcrR family transcriptional regulator
MARKAQNPRHIIDTALKLAAEGRWDSVGLRDIADAAGVSLAELHDRYPSKTAIVRAWSAVVDAEVLAASTALDPEDSPRDRLFDVLMRRFDALKGQRDAVAAIAGASMRDPLAGLCLSAGLMQSMRWMLEAAGIRTAGPKGRMLARGLTAVWLATLRVWLNDDSEDMASTMAALDRNLKRAERIAGLLPSGRRRRRAETAEPDTAAA